jgi:hypothetical protein
LNTCDLDGRGERIRTSDPLVPNQVLYQAEPLPERLAGYSHKKTFLVDASFTVRTGLSLSEDCR